MSGSPEYSGLENVRGDLESERRCQDLVVNLVRNWVANLVDIRTESTVHLEACFYNYCGLCRVMSKSKMGLWNPQPG